MAGRKGGGGKRPPRRNAKGQGRKRKPTELRRLEGNPGRRPLNEQEPDFGAAEENVIPGPWKGSEASDAAAPRKKGAAAAASGAKPPVPADLGENEVAIREWLRLFPRLARLKVVQATDVSTLVLACLAYADVMEARTMVATHGSIVKEPIVTKAGNIVGSRWKRAPWLIQFKDSAALYRAYASELGLTPSSRAALFGAEADADDVESYLDGLSGR